MPWSTREIADLAGTSLRAVRHYHEVGLLPEPERRSNGYKQYGVPHLVRLLRIKRLVDLGFSLAQIGGMADDGDHPREALRALDADLAATVERLQRIRVELGLILRDGATPCLPAGLVPPDGGASLTEADRAMVTVLSRVLGPTHLEAYGELLRTAAPDPTDAEFNALPADADAATREALAERMIPNFRRLQAAYPALYAPATDAPRGARFVVETTAAAVRELYNPAQVDVLRRLGVALAAVNGPPAAPPAP